VDRCGRIPTLWPAGLLALALLLGSPVPSEAAVGQGPKQPTPNSAMDAGLIKAIDQVMAMVALEHQMGQRVPGLDSGLLKLMQALLNDNGQTSNHHHHHRHHRHHHHHRFGAGLANAGGNEQTPITKTQDSQTGNTSSTSSKARHRDNACAGASVGKYAGHKGKQRMIAARSGNPNQPGACIGKKGETNGQRHSTVSHTGSEPAGDRRVARATTGTGKSAGKLTKNNGQTGTGKGNSGQVPANTHPSKKPAVAQNTGSASPNKGKTGTGTVAEHHAGHGGKPGAGNGAAHHAGQEGGHFKAGISHTGHSHGSGSKKH
jgi:hypothetical protein